MSRDERDGEADQPVRYGMGLVEGGDQIRKQREERNERRLRSD